MREFARRSVRVSQKLAKVSLFVVLTLVSLISAVHVRQPEVATAATSSNLNFQARLLNSAGNTVPDGYYNVEFNLYNASSGGTTLWTETYYDSNGVTAGNDNRLRVVNGYLSANLGSLTAFPTTINWDQEHWITMNIGGSTQTATPTWDGEMNPRLKLTAVPYAFKAGELAKTTGGNVSTLKFDTQTTANSILLPDEAGTLCIRNSTSCGFAASSGSANYIQNGTTGQTANFNIQSASSSSVTGVLQGASSQTADLLQFKDSSGVILTAFDSAGKLVFGPSGSQDTNLYRSAANTLKTDDALVVTGNLTVNSSALFQNSSDSTTAFQVQNSAGTSNLIVADTQNSRIGIGASPATSLITIGTNTTAATGGATFGTDTNLYRSAAGELKTDGDMVVGDDLQVGDTLLLGNALSFTNVGMATFTTPVGSSVGTKINIPLQTLSTYEQLLAFGLNSGSDSTSRAISIFDARSGAHQPTLGVFSPNETNAVGFSWEGSNSDAYLKTTAGNITIRSNTTDIATFNSTGNVGIAGKLTLNGSGTPTTSADGLQLGSDVNLYRAAASVLQSTAAIEVTRASAGNIAFASFVTGDSNDRFTVNADGTIQFGSGSGAVDTNLYRSAANTLKTDDSFIVGGSQFNNTGSTLNTALALGDLAAGPLGSNTTTVDIKTSFTIAPTVAGRTYTIPTPSDTAAGRIIYISNVHGSNNFIIGSATFNAGTTGSFVWDGSGWRPAGIDTGVTTVGALNGGTANANGATITGTTIYQQSASTSYAGLVDTTTQSFTGDKTFKSTTNSTTAFQLQDSASSSLLTGDTSNLALSVTSRSSSGVTVDSQNDGRAVTIDTTAGNFVKNGSFETNALNWTNMTRTSGTGASSPGDFYGAFPSSDWVNGSSTNSVANLTGNLSTSTAYTLTFYAQTVNSFSGQPVITASFGGSSCAGASPSPAAFSGANWVRYTCTITTGGGTYNTITFNDAIASNPSCLFGCTPQVLIDGVRLEVGSTATAYKYGKLTSSVDTLVKTSINSNTALLVQNAAGTTVLGADTINGSVSVGTSYANGIFSAGSSTYSTGTITQSTTSITGSGTTFTQNMSGGTIYYPDGTSSVVTYVSGTSLTSSVSKTVAAGSAYTIVYGGLTVKSGGSTYVQPTTNTTTAFQVQNASSINLLSADTTNMRISIGSIGTATSQFYVSGSLPTTHAGTVNTSVSNDGPSSVAVQGRYAYVLNNATATLKAYDVSNPSSPVDLSSSIGTGTAPNRVAIAGKYAYIVNSNTTSSQIKSVDITNPTSLAAGSALTPSGTGNLSAIAIQGRYAYVTDSANSIIRVIDISNPLNMVQVGSASTTSTTPVDIAVQGKYAFMIFSGSSTMRKFDISDPTTPSNVGSVSTVDVPKSIAIQGRYAFVTSGDTTKSLQIFDISSNTIPAAVGSVTVGTTPTSVVVQGRYAYLVNSGANTMQMIDISNVTAPTSIGTVTTNTTPSAVTVSGRYAYVVNSGTNPDTLRTYDLGGAYIQQLEVGGLEADSITTRNDLTVGNNVSIRGGLNVGGSTQLGSLGVSGITNIGDLTFGEGATRNLNVQTRTTNAIGSALTISAGAAGSGASAFAGGVLTLQGGAAGGTGNANGGAVTISGGAAVGSGTQGLVNLATSAFTSASEQAFTSSTSITAGNVDLYSSLPVKANTNTGSVLTVPDPAQATIGRLLYISARSGSLDFTMRLNSARTPIDIAMKQNSTATLIWNGTDWTAAGASSSTDLQSAYNNTLTSAGGAELVLNAPGGNADGLTIRNNATTPITGGILEVQTSIGSNLFSVNNNATEYATNGGAETQGASSSTFPASTWGAAPAGGTVTRNTTAANNATGTASVSIVTTTTSHGAADTLSAALTANLQYTVSFTTKGATNFSTLDVIYSRDGTNTSTTSCTTGKTVTTSVWSRITCTFTAPSSGITSSNAIFIRQSDATGRTFYVDNLSVNVNASVNHAADGSVDSALGTNWTDFGTNGSGTTTVVRNTSTIYDTSGSVEKTTGATATKGIRNNMPITPSVSTQYLVTFYARSSNTFTDITAGFLPAGGDTAPIAAQQCTDYNTQTVSTTGWTKITCIVTTPSSGISDPDIVIYQPTGTARTFYVDALTVTLNTNTASNVQVGQGNKGGPTTLFTLDRSSTAPISDNNDAYLGSMYYDTTSGRIQCYEADGWGACGAAPDNIVNLNPEFAGAVLNGSGVGTMSADFCGNGGGLSVNTGLCTSGQARNYYKWTSPQASQQTYSIYVTYQLPASFKNFASDDTVQLTARTDNTTNGVVTYEMFRNESGSISACGTETTVTTTVDTWQTVGVNGNESTGCSFSTSSANAFVIFKINVKSNTNANVYVGTLSFTTAGR